MRLVTLGCTTMIIENKHLLAELRKSNRRCGWCGKSDWKPDCHHHRCKGMDSGRRLDVRINILLVGHALPYPACHCHTHIQGGNRTIQECVLKFIAERETCWDYDIEDVLFLFERLPKCPTKRQLRAAISELGETAQRLAWREIGEAKDMGAISY